MTKDARPHGIFFVLSAPSGGGKTTICKRVLTHLQQIAYSVSYTTRLPRQNEHNGKDYFFVDCQTFQQYRDQGQFLECARVHNAWYGTHEHTLRSLLAQGTDVILDIDIQGAHQLRQKMTNGVFIFIFPPSLSELEKRLRGRKSDDEENIRIRLDIARQEMGHFVDYDYLVINDELEQAVHHVVSIIEAERCRLDRLNKQHFIDSLLTRCNE